GRAIIRSEMPHSNVVVKVDVDGGISLYTGTAEIGQGCDTVQAMIVAEVLGVNLRRVRVVAGDSDLTPLDLGSYSSRVTFMAGNAALQAARQIRDRLADAISQALSVPVERLEFRDERVFDREDPGRSVSFDEAVYMALQESGGTLVGKGAYSPPPEAQGGTYKGAGVGPSPAYSYSASVAEVSVDVETGQVRVERVWTAHDCGRALNPMAVEGQIEGSISMGLGQALTEQVVMQDGRILNPGLLEYKTPGLLDHPVIESLIVESVDPEGPFGAKEAGEGSLAGVIPAIANAVYDAVGVRIDRLPITPERVLEALRKARAAGRPAEKPAAVAATSADA
ncbi:MAG: molybdopterin-dependent oxidoreductase, partial [Acidobacteria bacterium]|nr:molybdopterin-dependent oxidoreductase [Acidobacteriota bacterium]MDW7985560.1 aldehyde oxidase [Acidobacteriota bacterium]